MEYCMSINLKVIFVYRTFYILVMTDSKNLNRIKVVLAEKQRTNKWLAEQLGKGQATISKWCTNHAQPNLETLVEIARCLEVDVSELIRKE